MRVFLGKKNTCAKKKYGSRKESQQSGFESRQPHGDAMGSSRAWKKKEGKSKKQKRLESKQHRKKGEGLKKIHVGRKTIIVDENRQN
jgi:hypothetical protein